MSSELDTKDFEYKLYEENLDLNNFIDESKLEIQVDFLNKKYESHPPDLLISVGSPGSTFIKNHPEILPNSRRVSIYSTKITTDKHSIVHDVSIDYISMLNEIKRLTEPEKIFVIGSRELKIFNAQLIELEDILKKTEIIYDLIILKSMVDIKEHVSNLPEDSVIFILSFPLKGDGKTYTPSEVITEVSNYSSVPVFSDSKITLKTGVVGGYLSDPRNLGEIAGQIAIKTANGVKIEGITEVNYSYIYDWNALERWGLTHRVPDNAEIINLPSPFWLKPMTITSIFFLTLIIFVVIYIFIKIQKKHISSDENFKDPFDLLSKREIEVVHSLCKGDTIKKYRFRYEYF